MLMTAYHFLTPKDPESSWWHIGPGWHIVDVLLYEQFSYWALWMQHFWVHCISTYASLDEVDHIHNEVELWGQGDEATIR